LSWPLVDQPEENSEGDVKEKAAADQLAAPYFLTKFPFVPISPEWSGYCPQQGSAARRGRVARGPSESARASRVLFVMKPDQAMVLQVVIDGQDRHDAIGFCGIGVSNTINASDRGASNRYLGTLTARGIARCIWRPNQAQQKNNCAGQQDRPPTPFTLDCSVAGTRAIASGSRAIKATNGY